MRTLPAGSSQGDAAVDIRTGSRPKLEAANESMPPPEGRSSEGPQRLRSLPPFDPTVARPSKKPLPKNLLPTPKPILASECLRDDVAPIDPNDRAARWWSAGLGSAMLACAIGMLVRAWPLPGGADATLQTLAAIGVTGIVVAVLAIAVRRYALRGALVLAAVIVGAGALLALQHDGVLVLARWLAPAPLAAALFLRASYRSDQTVRAMLGVSIALFLAAALFVGGTPVLSEGASLTARLFAGAMAVVGGLSLLGFMGEETTAGCSAWGTFAALLGAGSLVVDSFVRPGAPGVLAMAAAALAVPIAAIAVFQVVATIVGPRMRVRTSSRASLPAAPPEEPDHDESMLPNDD